MNEIKLITIDLKDGYKLERLINGDGIPYSVLINPLGVEFISTPTVNEENMLRYWRDYLRDDEDLYAAEYHSEVAIAKIALRDSNISEASNEFFTIIKALDNYEDFLRMEDAAYDREPEDIRFPKYQEPKDPEDRLDWGNGVHGADHFLKEIEQTEELLENGELLNPKLSTWTQDGCYKVLRAAIYNLKDKYVRYAREENELHHKA